MKYTICFLLLVLLSTSCSKEPASRYSIQEWYDIIDEFPSQISIDKRNNLSVCKELNNIRYKEILLDAYLNSAFDLEYVIYDSTINNIKTRSNTTIPFDTTTEKNKYTFISQSEAKDNIVVRYYSEPILISDSCIMVAFEDCVGNNSTKEVYFFRLFQNQYEVFATYNFEKEAVYLVRPLQWKE